MKKKIIFALKIALAIILLAATIVGLWYQTFLTIFAWIAIVKIAEHWQTALFITIVAVLSCVGGFGMIWLIHLISTGEFFIDLRSTWSIGFLFACIYAMGIILEEDQRQPYIWLWKQIKKLGHVVRKVQAC